MLEEVIVALPKQCEVAKANGEAWKSEALRPGNKRGAMATGQTPMTDVRVRSRVTPSAGPGATGRVNPQLKAMVKRHQQEVELLKEMRLRELNAQKESEEEIDRLKDSLARLETAKKCGATNLKSKLDEAADGSSRTMKAKDTPVVLVSQREAALRDERKKLRNLKKDDVIAICEKEGMACTRLEDTKETIVQARVNKILEDDERSRDLSKIDSIVEVTDDGDGDSPKVGGCDAASS
ncbi:hypothetical protein CBR_g41014 [Chara braunii]|uniref:Uncharacterized protein n=1 Tax=Chara braunii TaxID=69332 RepID=A0A388LV26_CHABU|nr:hypothetical protein CBR_g41014 [Chara braunii]|eukprot:GBG86111.1 hypothetical protein CBR_g41014 [Chara braunii]